jgi:hypothetical protein
MSWIFLGTGVDISMGVDSVGSFQLLGRGTQRCEPSGGDLAVMSLTKDIDPLWTINAEPLAQTDLGPGPMDIRKYFNERRGRTSAAIHFFKGYAPGSSKIVANILVLPTAMDRVFQTATLLVGRQDLQYVLTIHFLGLRMEGADSPAPSLAEFSHSDPFKQRPYFSDYVTFNVQARVASQV